MPLIDVQHDRARPFFPSSSVNGLKPAPELLRGCFRSQRRIPERILTPFIQQVHHPPILCLQTPLLRLELYIRP